LALHLAMRAGCADARRSGRRRPGRSSRARAAPLLRGLMRLARAMGPTVLPKSPLGEALTYLRNPAADPPP